MSVLKQLETWFAANCNGEWEHTYGVKIDTIDNPGWEVEVDLEKTPWAHLKVPRRQENRSDDDWIDIRVLDARFVAFGGPRNLEELIVQFLNIVGNHESRGTMR